mgnify:CR=1 FL=1
MFRHFYLAAFWTLLTVILLCVPGNDLPKVRTISIPQFDKFVHIVLFGAFQLFWTIPFALKQQLPRFRKTNLLFLTLSVLLGVLMEFVQRDFVPLRSFDVMDIISDSIGAFVGFLISGRIGVKRAKNKKAPVETGALNQN